MKVKLEFDLEQEFEDKAAKRAMSATDAYLALHHMKEFLRRIAKYGTYCPYKDGDEQLNEQELDLIDCIRHEFHEVLDTYNINMDDLE